MRRKLGKAWRKFGRIITYKEGEGFLGDWIKGLAEHVFFVGFWFSVAGCVLVFLYEEKVLLGYLVFALGVWLSWLLGLFVCGFGELLRNYDVMAMQHILLDHLLRKERLAGREAGTAGEERTDGRPPEQSE